MSQNAKEPAFPLTYGNDNFHQIGLSKRELFAAMAMQGMLADPNCQGIKEVAEAAVKFADALIQELERTSCDEEKS